MKWLEIFNLNQELKLKQDHRQFIENVWAVKEFFKCFSNAEDFMKWLESLIYMTNWNFKILYQFNLVQNYVCNNLQFTLNFDIYFNAIEIQCNIFCIIRNNSRYFISVVAILRGLVPLKLKFSNFWFFKICYLSTHTYRMQKAKFKVGTWALFLR